MAETMKTSKSNEPGVFQEVEFNRFGLIVAILLIVGCLGGITVGLGAINSVFALSLVVISTMATLSMLLAVAPMKMILASGLIAIAIDVVILAYYLFLV